MRRLLETVESAAAYLTYGALFLMMTLITIDAIGRYVLNFVLPDVYHLTELYLMPLAIFFAMALTQKQRGHVNVTLISQFFNPRLNACLQGLVFLATSVICGLIVYASWGPSWEYILQWRVTGGVVPWPTGLSRIIVPLGMSVLCIRLVVDGVSELLRAITDGGLAPAAAKLDTENQETENGDDNR